MVTELLRMREPGSTGPRLGRFPTRAREDAAREWEPSARAPAAPGARPRFAPVFYLGEPTVGSERDVRLLLLRALQRGRDFYPRVGDEYRRIGYGPGARGFDDRSTAFGVAAISFSHAITDVARVLRYVWMAGGGGDPRRELWSDAGTTRAGQGLLLLPRTGGR